MYFIVDPQSNISRTVNEFNQVCGTRADFLRVNIGPMPKFMNKRSPYKKAGANWRSDLTVYTNFSITKDFVFETCCGYKF